MKPSVIPALVVSVASFCAPAAALAQQPGATLAAPCFTCHGTDGNSVQGVPPSLAGRASAEIFQAMKDFQSGKRPATIMHQQARGYTDPQIQSIAAYFASVKPAAPRVPAKP